MGFLKTSREIFSKNVKLYRERRRWTQAQLAEYSDMSVKMIQKIEYGKVSPTPETMDKLAKALEIDVFKFYEDEDPRPPHPPPPLVSPHPGEPQWRELSRLVQHYLSASRDKRLLSLYILSGGEGYLKEYEQIPDAAPISRVLKKSL